MDYTKKICCVPCLETIKSLKTKCEDLNKLISLESKKMFIYSTLQNLGGHNCKSFIKKAVSEGYIKWNEEYEVEDIIDHCNEEGDVFYLIKWKGWASKFNSWEPEKHLKCTDLLNEYHKQNRLKRKRKLDSTNNVHSERNKERTEDLFLKVVEAVENYDGLLDMISDYVQLRKKSTLRKKNLKKNSRSETWQALKQWENDINHTAKSYDAAYLYVENKVDFEGPPENFVYINERKEGPGVKIPKDPLIGCECTDCFENKKNCCPAMSESSLAYYKANRRLRVGRGVPIFECNKRCKCGPDCCNRVVQKGRKFPMCIFRTENGRGWGVKTLKCIKKGSFVVEYVGEVITNEEAENRGKYYDAVGHTYLFDLDFNESDALYTVDAGKYGNAAHFINHSRFHSQECLVMLLQQLDGASGNDSSDSEFYVSDADDIRNPGSVDDADAGGSDMSNEDHEQYQSPVSANLCAPGGTTWKILDQDTATSGRFIS
ncbi:hypothetical protein Btru_061971 [Bulinus truncatus]|nr:hypothetical protein Btru_061971 [Bulinus truncatus]